MDTFEELLLKEEELDVELRVRLETTGHGFQMLRHPLVTTLYHGRNALHNAALKAQKERLHEHMERGEWEQAIWTYERPYRLDAFAIYHAHLPIDRAADLLLDVWLDTEFPHQRRAVWLRLFKKLRPHSKRMRIGCETLLGMEPADPERRLTVYRGMLAKEGSKRYPYGMSWTVDQSIARWFSTRFAKNGVVRHAEVRFTGVFCYLMDRGEWEVVVDPRQLMNVSDV